MAGAAAGDVTNGIVIIHVADPPKVTLSLGSTLNPDEIKEGDDVYFECHIKANPKENRIAWAHDVSGLEIIVPHIYLRDRPLVKN